MLKSCDLTKAQRWKLADLIRDERLPSLNKKMPTVKIKNTFYIKYGKRLLDIIFSTIALILTLPINLIICIVTIFDLGFPIFFSQQRTGLNGKVFKLVKFRNMTNEKDERGELLPVNQRVTKMGKFLRKTSLDELLNFWSIFKGDMSLIGPRPLVTEYYDRFSDRHKCRTLVRPGLECPQHITLDHHPTWEEQFENDIWYVENISFFTDCYLLYKLFAMAINKKSMKIRSTGKRGIFMGYAEDGSVLTLEMIPQELIDKYEQELSIV